VNEASGRREAKYTPPPPAWVFQKKKKARNVPDIKLDLIYVGMYYL
jgi:hypothetical protein